MSEQSVYTTRVVGVTFEGRQRVVSLLVPGESLQLRREPNNVHDSNAIRVDRLNGQQVGYISRELARQIAPVLDKLGGIAPAAVIELTGGGLGYNCGVVISFNLSQQQQSMAMTTETGLRIPPEPEYPPWDYDWENQSATPDDFEEDYPQDYESGLFPRVDEQVLLSPTLYAMATGQNARILEELVALCIRNRPTAATQFVRGFILHWLEETAAALRKQHRHDLADKYEVAAISAQIVLERFVSRTSDSPLEPQLALEEWLCTLPGYRPAPRLRAFPLEIHLSPHQAGDKHAVEIQVANEGTGILVGSLQTNEPWLEILDKEFVGFSAEPSNHRIVITTPDESVREEGSILVASSGGQNTIRVIAPRERRRIQVEPTVLDFGEVLPGSWAKTLEIKNLGNVPADVTVHVNDPVAVKVQPTAFTLLPQGSSGGPPYSVTDSKQSSQNVRVEVNWAEVARCPTKDEPGLLIRSDSDSALVLIRGKVVRPILRIDTTELRILLDREGKGEGIIVVANSGSGQLTVWPDRSVNFLKGQMEISPLMVSCRAGESKHFSVRLHILDLHPGAAPPQGELVFRSNGGDKEVMLITGLPGPWLLVTPVKIDFGCVEKEPLPHRQLCIQNIGDDILLGQIASEEPWLVIEETSFRLSPKESKDIIMRPVTDHPVKLLLSPITRRELTTAIRVTSNGGQACVPAGLVSKYHG